MTTSASIVDCAAYRDGTRLPGRWTPADALAEVRRHGTGFVWAGLFEPDAEHLRDIAEIFGLHELGVEDAVRAYQRPKLERYDGTLFTVFKTVRHVEHDSPTTAHEIVETGEIMAFLGADFIVTVRRREHSRLRRLRDRLEAAPERLALGPAVVLHAIADHVVDAYHEVTSAFERDIDEVEALVFAPRSLISAEQMYLIKREIVELRRSVTPLATPLRVLGDTETPLIPQQVRSYFHDVDNNLESLTERIAGFDELLTSLLDATLAKVTLQQNNDMRKITAWAAIVAVPTMGAGIYGMNFDHMPELRWTYGYPIVMTVILLVCLLLHRMLKRNGWL
nr:magnesium and cobalt transport protein CorA [Amycolatopsis anabasis]